MDVLASATDEFIDDQGRKYGMTRGSMNLIDATRAIQLYQDMGPATEMSGGSAGNTIACFASFGGKGAYVGKVGKDQLGEIFRHDLKSIGVDHFTAPVESGTHTGRSMILFTSDGQRTMNTFLGAAVELSPSDIDEDVISNADVTYLEGYLFDPPLAMEAFYKAAKIAHGAGKKVSLTLSDPFCVGRHRKPFQDLVEGHVDILFANEDEIKSLYEVHTLEEAIETIKGKCEIVAVTRSEKGSIILKGHETTIVTAEPVSHVVDTTGAGDAYAAGFLYGYTENMSMAQCGKMGSIAAAEIISHVGPRPQVRLSTLIPRKAA